MVTLFAQKNNNYLLADYNTFDNAILEDWKVLHLGLDVDTEFEDARVNVRCKHKSFLTSKTLTGQVKDILDEQGMIFDHPDMNGTGRHPEWKSEFIVFDYLKAQGFDVRCEHFDSKIGYNENHRILHIHLFAHFALAELFRIFQGELRTHVQKMVLARADKQFIKQQRRLQTYNRERTNHEQQWVNFEKCIVWINGHPFRLRLTIWDTIAIAGNQSLDNLAKLAGYEMEYKSTFTAKEKGRMGDIYFERPEDFDNYALGDLCVYDILTGFHNNVRRIFEEVGLLNYFKPGESVRMTIGATVEKLFKAALMSKMNIKDVKVLRSLTQYGTCEEIKKRNLTSKFLAKVDGGRCRNHRQLIMFIKTLLCDIDINGCYGNGLRNQGYPVGRPVFFDYDIDTENNDYVSLGDFLKDEGDELVPGYWYMRVSTKPGYILKYPQDLLQSWEPPKNLEKVLTDTELEAREWWTEDNVGLSKIFTHEIKLAIITHDILQWIEHTCSKHQRAELMENLIVVAALYYPASCKVGSVQEVIEANKNHTGKNTTKVTGRKKKRIYRKEEECYAWCEINIGDLIVNDLLKKRKQYSKNISEEALFNELYKLFINTIYGDQVSPYFDIGNTCVGNNITARARCMAWYMEKGFNGFQTITDGCTFELNKVVHPDNGRLTASTVFNVSNKYINELNIKFAPLGNNEITVSEWSKNDGDKVWTAHLLQDGKELTYNAIGELAMKHLQNIFPKEIDVLHKRVKDLKGNEQIGQFTLEVKCIADAGAFHGSANYLLRQNKDYYLAAKMRSYRKDLHECVDIVDGELDYTRNDYNPAFEFLVQLLTNPNAVKRAEVFLDKSILKPGTYKQHFDSRYTNGKLFPGCGQVRARVIREFSLNQFTFQTLAQYRAWEREWKFLIDKTGQSYENFFLNADDTVNVQEMVRNISKCICKGQEGWFKRGGVRKYLKTISEGSEGDLDLYTKIKCLKLAQKNLNEIYGFEIYLDDESEVSDEMMDFETCDN